ncbi:MAG: HAD-IA family hydrolase, partial [Candidatus Sumerlaeia bacterium]|nr:HAD-IA family hydrolase [Candidatus Sumerlaeia bacterium]
TVEPRHLFRSIRAIILDFETALVPTERLYFEALRRALERWNQQITAAAHLGMVSRSRRETCERFVAELKLNATWSELAQQVEAEYRTLVAQGHIPVYRASLRFVLAIPPSQYFRCLATNLPMEQIEPIVEGARLRKRFDAIVSGERLPPKPNPDYYLSIIETAAVTPAQCVVIEGSAAGILSAARAGARTVAVVHKTARNQDFSRAHVRVDSLDVLIPYL